MGRLAQSFDELEVYREAFQLQQEVSRLSKHWPRMEDYSLTDQIRRSSRSVGANLAEAWAKRRYPAHFLSKLTDSDWELQETRHWLTTASSCDYIDTATCSALTAKLQKVGRLLGSMIADYESFTVPH